jgi:hypothetical protein
MHRLVLAVFTLLNLSSIPWANAAEYIQYDNLFGRGVTFYPFSQPSYQARSVQSNYVGNLGQFTLYPHYFPAQHGKKRLIVLDNDVSPLYKQLPILTRGRGADHKTIPECHYYTISKGCLTQR